MRWREGFTHPVMPLHCNDEAGRFSNVRRLATGRMSHYSIELMSFNPREDGTKTQNTCPSSAVLEH